MHDICSVYNYYPYFAVAEYGFTATPSPCGCWNNNPYIPENIICPDNANVGDESQAVYYLRSSLMNATMKDTLGNGWFLCSRFSHNFGTDCNTSIWDFGWHNDDESESQTEEC